MPVGDGTFTYAAGGGRDHLRMFGGAEANNFQLTKHRVLLDGEAKKYTQLENIKLFAGDGRDRFTSLAAGLQKKLESVSFFGQGDNDLIELTAAKATTFIIDGGVPVAPASPGDVLVLKGSSGILWINRSKDTSGTVRFANRKDIKFESIETLIGHLTGLQPI